MDRQLLLENIVSVDAKLVVRVSDPKHQHLGPPRSRSQGLFLGGWQTNGFDNHVKVIRWNFFLGGVDRLNAKVLPVVGQLFVRPARQGHFMNPPGFQDLSKELPFKAVPDYQSRLVWVSF